MKRQELAQMREKKMDELVEKINEKRKEVVKTYGRMKVGKEKNLKLVKRLKKEIAQLLTIVGSKKEDK